MIPQSIRLYGALVLVMLTPVLGVSFLTGSRASAEIIVRSFNAKETLQTGQVVALSLNDQSAVEPAPATNSSRIYGVVVDQNAAPLSLSKPGQKVFVATGGVYPVLVSAENGPIGYNDYLSMSSSNGIAAKSKGDQAYIVGRAAQSLNGSNGKIAVLLTPGKDPRLGETTAVPGSLRRLAEAIAGQPLSASRIYAALVIFIVTAAVAFGLLWVGVRSGMIAIGRNPLSKHSIIQGLAQVIFAAAVVFASGLLGIYLLLRL